MKRICNLGNLIVLDIVNSIYKEKANRKNTHCVLGEENATQNGDSSSPFLN
ncbi:hypothetical protein GGR09_001276 [Bartonella heixiaziensis]